MIVVTGGAGFIGSNIVAGLEERGYGPILVSDTADSEEKRGNLHRRTAVELVHPDRLFERLDALTEAAGGDSGPPVRSVVHMGAISSTVETDAELLWETNVHLSQRIWRWCVEQRVPLIYASSAATYGSGEAGFDDAPEGEGGPALEPLNLYGSSKHEFDAWVLEQVAAGEPTPPQWVGLKFFNVYGPNEYHKGGMRSLVAKSFEDVRAGRPVRLFRSHRPDVPDGGQSRDFVYVADCVSVVLWLLEHPQVNGIFNVGTGEARSFLDLVTALHEALGRELRIEWTDTPEVIRDRYQYFTEARMDRLREAGYDLPFHSVEQGVRDYVERFLSAEDRYR